MRLREAWSRETSSDPDNWTPDNPAWGQCAVSALVLQDLIGGDLIRCEVDGISHYAVRHRRAGGRIDPTWEQFIPRQRERGEPLPMTTWETRTREYVLSNPETVRRYELLKKRLGGSA